MQIQFKPYIAMSYIGHVLRKPVLRVCHPVLVKQVYTGSYTETKMYHKRAKFSTS